MASSLFRVETGFSIDDSVDILYGVNAPSPSGVYAPAGSLYMQNATGAEGGALWVKYGDADTAWNNISEGATGLRWLPSVRATTGDDISAFSGTAVTFTDDQIGITVSIGDRVASKFDDKIYVVNAGTWTVAADGNLANKDSFFSEYTFIFSADASMQGPYAIMYNGSDLIKLAAFDFEYATTIKLSAGYTPANGDPAAGDTVEKAIGNLDANQDDIQTTLGVAQGDTNLGTWTTPAYLTDNVETVKTAIDKLNTGLSEARTESSAGPITSTPVVVDSMLVDNFDAAHWLVVCYETATPSKKIAEEVFALHDGTASADATTLDYTKYAKIKTTPLIIGLSVSVTISGTGATQTMNLVVSSTTSVMVKAVRVSV